MADPSHESAASAPDGAEQPTPEQLAERSRRADLATRRAMAAVLGLEALVVLLVPRAIRFTIGLGATRTALLIALAVLLVAAAALARRRWGIGVGSALQIPFLLTGVWIAAMYVVGAIFIGIWAYLLNLRRELVGTPSGVRMLYS
jgi:hypothetical protein